MLQEVREPKLHLQCFNVAVRDATQSVRDVLQDVVSEELLDRIQLSAVNLSVYHSRSVGRFMLENLLCLPDRDCMNELMCHQNQEGVSMELEGTESVERVCRYLRCRAHANQTRHSFTLLMRERVRRKSKDPAWRKKLYLTPIVEEERKS